VLGVDTALYDKICQRLVTGQWFIASTQVSSVNKTDCHEILLKVASNTIVLTPNPTILVIHFHNFYITECQKLQEN
jgi:hypothetical protein